MKREIEIVIVTSRDVMALKSVSLRSAQRTLKRIKDLIGKSRHQYVTLEEYCYYDGRQDVDEVRARLVKIRQYSR